MRMKLPIHGLVRSVSSLLSLMALFVIPLESFGDDFYRKHLYIVVDQTPDVQNAPGTQEIFKWISDSILNNTNGILSFDKDKDEISLFTFAIDGTYGTPGSYRDIKFKIPVESQYNLFCDRFIQFRGNSSEDESLGQFIKGRMSPLFMGGDRVSQLISQNSGVTLSKYVYPSIINSINSHQKKPAVENIILYVTNFQSGMDDLGTSADVTILRDMVGAYSLSYFQRQFENLEEPFYQIPLSKVVFNSGNGKQAQPSIHINKLCLKSLAGTSVYVSSNVKFQEDGYNSDDYQMDNAEVVFNYDPNALRIDSIVFKVNHGQSCLYRDDVTNSAVYDESRRVYEIPSANINLGKVFSVGDSIDCEYAFYGWAKDDEGNDIMPLVFVANRDFVFKSENLISLMEDRTNMLITVLSILLLIIIIGLVWWRIYCKRGKSRNVEMDFDVVPLSNERFMEVKGCQVVALDCWYWKAGELDRNIHIKGDFFVEKKQNAKGYRCRPEIWIDDVDLNEDFSFKPDPQLKKPDGSSYPLKEWIPLSEDNGGFSYDSKSHKGNFKFDVRAYIDTQFRENGRPNFDITNILKLQVKVRMVMLDKDYTPIHYFPEKELVYSFIVRPEIANSDLWVAFDPGTTGSCVAYGRAVMPTAKDDLFMAENEFQTIEGTNKFSHIFPSKIRINKQSNRLFGNVVCQAESLMEGEEEDFLFGNQAEILWNKNGVNCFQSIKKLLGYNGERLIIGDSPKDSPQKRSMSGQDLAHLLVKGLCNHFEDYLKHNPNIDKDVRNLFLEGNELRAKRAIVAVPNNYTMVKIQDMVDSVKRTGRFIEVHYIYESEAVFMMYMRSNWAQLPKLQNKMFVVFDMGGATINATAFGIKVNMNDNNNISDVEVTTLAKIGYGIGGDDIDYSLIQMMYEIPTIKESIMLASQDSLIHQQLHKDILISLAREIKLSIIDHINKVQRSVNYLQDNKVQRSVNYLQDEETFYGHIKDKFYSFNLSLPVINDEVRAYLKKQEKFCNSIQTLVIQNVRDAVKELLLSLNVKKVDIELILSGRSTLYPHIKQTVIDQINEMGYTCADAWSGFNGEDGKLSDQLVKTAVAQGACWYAMYSTRIKMNHDILTSTFGYIDIKENEQHFVPLLNVNQDFDVNGELESESVKPIDQGLSDVKFVQMLGNNFNEILEKDIKHKYNILDEVSPRQITGMIDSIEIKVDNKNNFNFVVTLPGSIKITEGRYGDREIKIEITDENSPAYVFATTNTLDIDANARDESSKTNKQTNNRKRNF